jgi:hypothetical protein
MVEVKRASRRSSRRAADVRRALGREPGNFGDYARRTAAAGVWNGVPAAA